MKTEHKRLMINQSGFTIVEILVVIVVIGVLASIVISAYTGVSARARTAKAQSALATVQRKAEAYNVFVGSYPSGTVATSGFSTASPSDVSASLQGSGIAFANGTLTSAPANGSEATIEYDPCTSPANVGGRLYYWDYNTNARSSAVNIGATCTAWGTITTNLGPF